MGLVNRDKDNSEKNYRVETTVGALANGASAIIGMVSSAGSPLAVEYGGKGVSNTPVFQLAVLRWTSAGVTSYNLGSAVSMIASYGTSGGMWGATFNSASYALQSGDMLVVNESGSNANVTDLAVAVVIQATQDIKTTFGV